MAASGCATSREWELLSLVGHEHTVFKGQVIHQNRQDIIMTVVDKTVETISIIVIAVPCDANVGENCRKQVIFPIIVGTYMWGGMKENNNNREEESTDLHWEFAWGNNTDSSLSHFLPSYIFDGLRYKWYWIPPITLSLQLIVHSRKHLVPLWL